MSTNTSNEPNQTIASDAFRLFSSVIGHVRPDLVIRPWTSTSWQDVRASGTDPAFVAAASDLYVREMSGTDDDGKITGRFAVVGPRIEPRIDRTSRRPMLTVRGGFTDLTSSAMVGPDGPTLHDPDDGWQLDSWQIGGSAIPQRWTVTFTGRLLDPVTEASKREDAAVRAEQAAARAAAKGIVFV